MYGKDIELFVRKYIPPPLDIRVHLIPTTILVADIHFGLLIG